LKQGTPNVMIYGELARFPLYIDIQTRVISYWCKLLTGKASKLSAISYKLLHSFFCNRNISAPWVKFVKDILDNCGLSNVWTFQNTNFNDEWVIAYVKLRLRDNFLQEWNSNLENAPKTLNYRLYKQIFEFENYFNILENKDIFTFCKFRTTNTNKGNNKITEQSYKGKVKPHYYINRQNNNQKKKYKRTNNDLQNKHIKLKIE
jgi:hypothetical protein